MTAEKSIKILKAVKMLKDDAIGTLIDTTDAYKMAIEALSSQSASSEQSDKDIKFPTIHCCRGYDCIKDENGRMGFGVYDPKEKNIYIAGDVPKEIFLKALFHEIFHWMQNVTGMKFDEDDANSFSDILYDAMDMFDDHGPELFGQKTIVEPGEVFVGESVLKEALDHIADSDKMDDLISRQMAIDAVLKLTYADGAYGYADAKELVDSLEALPSAQPECKTGRWIPVDSYTAFGGDEMAWLAHGNPIAYHYCSECKNHAYALEDGEDLLSDFCPNCGSPMLKDGEG